MVNVDNGLSPFSLNTLKKKQVLKMFSLAFQCLLALLKKRQMGTFTKNILSLYNHTITCFQELKPTKLNNRFLRERGMVTTPKMEYQVFLCIFQKNSAMATLGLMEMEKFLWEGKEKGLTCWLSQFSKTKLRQPTGQTFFPTFSKEFSHFPQS